MKPWKRMLFYLSLNVIVSACTVLTVLFLWDQFSGPMPRRLLPEALRSIAAAPTPTKSAGDAGRIRPQPTPTDEFVIYQVASGDTFESLAAKYNISVEELIAVNGFARSQPLGEGEVLRIPLRASASVVIDSVIGAGDLDTERVLLKQRGEGELSLVGWRLEDGQGNIFVFPQFPQLILYKGGAVNVYTKAGNNSVVDLYWGLELPVWASGKTVTLRDPQGNERANYQIP
ncbi:MAG: lamin tail domain-containing protein [Anaerolineales bacterium]|nr:lamin tail domain-containing protein [Anaerolineales bacterium]